MKRKLVDREHFGGPYQVELELVPLRDVNGQGSAARLKFGQVTNALWVTSCESQRCVIDSGFVWISLFRPGAKNVPTAMFDAAGELVQVYFDIVWDHGLDNRGIPWYDDLYLDVVSLPSGEVELLDRDELDAALGAGLVTEEQCQVAMDEATALLTGIRLGRLVEAKEFVQVFGN